MDVLWILIKRMEKFLLLKMKLLAAGGVFCCIGNVIVFVVQNIQDGRHGRTT